MKKILICWIGQTDLNAQDDAKEPGLGPIAQVLTTSDFDQAHLVYNYSRTLVRPYLKWLQAHIAAGHALAHSAHLDVLFIVAHCECRNCRQHSVDSKRCHPARGWELQ